MLQAITHPTILQALAILVGLWLLAYAIQHIIWRIERNTAEQMLAAENDMIQLAWEPAQADVDAKFWNIPADLYRIKVATKPHSNNGPTCEWAASKVTDFRDRRDGVDPHDFRSCCGNYLTHSLNHRYGKES